VEDIPSWDYFVVYKWQSHLASYISGTYITGGMEMLFDFTTWSVLYDAQVKNLIEDDGYRYQSAWDLDPFWSSSYDWEINWVDISVMTAYWFGGVASNHEWDLDGNGAIWIEDVWIIWTNYGKTDVFHPDFGFLSW